LNAPDRSEAVAGVPALSIRANDDGIGDRKFSTGGNGENRERQCLISSVLSVSSCCENLVLEWGQANDDGIGDE
jgi:hypothetical protein